MEKSSSEYIQIRILFPYKSAVNTLGFNGLLPVLTYLENSFLPKPLEVKFTGKSPSRLRKKQIQSYLDPQLLAILEPNGPTGTLINIQATHQHYCFIAFFQDGISHQIVIDIDLALVEQVTTAKLKAFFTDLLHKCPQTHYAQCCFTLYYSVFNGKHIEPSMVSRNNYLRFLVWLQYLSAEELIIQGGRSAFESNSLLQTEPLHNGLLVQVGESPYDIFTEEGEALLVKATFSLPPVQYPSKG
ncbi:MAG: hypothetical protein RLZZ628_76 [Bacteroidota bacterium]|jgi:hypothetical protein